MNPVSQLTFVYLSMCVRHVPTTDTPSPLVDAFMWLKTPGESDGCTQDLPAGGQCKR